MKWGVRKDERALSQKDQALNITQRSQVKLASGISALAAIGMTSNAAATLFQLQARFEHLKIAQAVIDSAQNNPFISDAGKEALKATKSHIIKGLIGSALATTAISSAIGIVTHRTAKAYFAPIHKVYGDAKPKIRGDLKKLSKDIKSGKRAHLTKKEYEAEVSKIVEKHMTKDMSNVLSPFHELARTQLGLELNTKKLNISFEKLPNTDLASKMTITTPTGLKLVKAIKVVEHSDIAPDSLPDMELYFDYQFDADGHVEDWSCPTIEIADDLFENRFDLASVTSKYDPSSLGEGGVIKHDYIGTHTVVDSDRLDSGVKGMKWGIRKSTTAGPGKSSFHKAEINKIEALKKEIASGKNPSKTGTADSVRLSRLDQHIKDHQTVLDKLNGTTNHVKNAGLKAATGEETSAMRYARLKADAKAGKGKDFTEEDLKFFNNRTDALKKVDALNQQNPGWLSKTTKSVLQRTAEKQMMNLADVVATKYIGAPISESITGAAAKALAEQRVKAASEALKTAKADAVKARDQEIAKTAADAAAARVKLDAKSKKPKTLFSGN